MKKVALVTCVAMPKSDGDGACVDEALCAAGMTGELVAWTAPCDWSRFDVVLLRTPWDYPSRAAAFAAWVAGVAARLVNPAPLVAWNMHKRYLLELAAHGVPIVPTTLVPAGSVPDLAAHGHDVIVVKRAIGSNADGNLRGPASALAADVRSAAKERDLLVQPFVPSIETTGETSLIYLGGRFSHAVRKLPKPGDYRVQDTHGGTFGDHVPTAAERDVAERALAATPGPCAYARVDLVAGNDGPLLMELELIEPELFLRRAPGSAARLVSALG